jgi:hypothetical protein
MPSSSSAMRYGRTGAGRTLSAACHAVDQSRLFTFSWDVHCAMGLLTSPFLHRAQPEAARTAAAGASTTPAEGQSPRPTAHIRK